MQLLGTTEMAYVLWHTLVGSRALRSLCRAKAATIQRTNLGLLCVHTMTSSVTVVMRKVILGEACLGLIIYFWLCLICILDVDSNLN